MFKKKTDLMKKNNMFAMQSLGGERMGLVKMFFRIKRRQNMPFLPILRVWRFKFCKSGRVAIISIVPRKVAAQRLSNAYLDIKHPKEQKKKNAIQILYMTQERKI